MIAVVTAEEAVAKIKDGATVLVNPVPSEEVYGAFGRVFEESGHPKDLTVVWSAGLGPFSEERRGMNHFAYPGMTKRVIAGHVGLNHAMIKMIAANECEAYNLPQGVMTQLYREIAAKRPGLLTRVGLGTFVDPRFDGGKLNERTRSCESLVELTSVGGQEMLFYKSFPVDVAVIRGTTADPNGNITCEEEAIHMEPLEAAMAARNCGGIVIAQVQYLTDTPANPNHVRVPGLFVDYVVVASSREKHPQTLFVEYDPSLCGKEHACLESKLNALPLNSEKIICRRAAMELCHDTSVNLGVGIPMGIASVAWEEGVLQEMTLSTEVGSIGGLPEGGKNFGPAKNPSAFMSQAAMFDYYDGGGLDLTCVGMAQVGRDGSVNVSKLGHRIIGSGGFINITQSTRKCLFCGEFTAVGLTTAVENGKLVIKQDGKVPKFIETVEQVTFSGPMASKRDQEVLYITERCVFKLTEGGIMLIEYAPGVDIERDIIAHMGFRPLISETVRPMDAAIFAEDAMGLAKRA